MFRQRSILAALAAVALWTGAALAIDPIKPSLGADKGAPFVHTVIFHLKKDAPADTADKIVADCHALLEAIPSVRSLRVGRPAPEDQSTPKFATRDYDVALVVLFDDPAGLKTYLDHDMHKKFVSAYEKYFDAVQVYDFIDPTKK